MTRLSLKPMRGAGLIEVLVTMLILSTTLLALTALQSRALQYSNGAYARSQANILAYDMFDRIRLNTQNIAGYTVALGKYSGSVVTTPRPAAEISEWRRDIDTVLPGAESSIACVAATRICTITVSWLEVTTSEDDSPDEEKSTFTYSARM